MTILSHKPGSFNGQNLRIPIQRLETALTRPLSRKHSRMPLSSAKDFVDVIFGSTRSVFYRIPWRTGAVNRIKMLHVYSNACLTRRNGISRC